MRWCGGSSPGGGKITLQLSSTIIVVNQIAYMHYVYIQQMSAGTYETALGS